MEDVLYRFFVEPWLYFRTGMLVAIVCCVTCGVIGSFIILRRMALVGDALAHAVLPGVVIGFLIGGKNPVSLFLGAVGAGVVTALLIGLVKQKTRVKEDTAIGVVFTALFAAGIMMISSMPRLHLDLQCYLFGDVLAATATDLWLTGVIGVVVLALVIVFYKQLVVTSFDPVMATSIGISAAAVHYGLMTLLSMTVVASLQAVGVVLVIAMLITPGATAYLLTHRMNRMLALAGVFGAISAVVGMGLANKYNTNSGPAMVCVAASFFVLAMLFSPKEGVALTALRRVRAARRVALEDQLKRAFSIQLTDAPLTIEKLAARSNLKLSAARTAVRAMKRRGLLTAVNGGYELTTSGKRKALEVIRAHRLWETFLSKKLGLSWDKLDAEAERVEHLLTPQMTAMLDETLSFPRVDPHGAPIPTPSGEVERQLTMPLLEMRVGQLARILRVKDEDVRALRVLAECGVTPNMEVELLEKSQTGDVTVRVNGNRHVLDRDVAEHILVARS
jgi:ABC-type Mn2+/Zn2+ transport system permease subunit/Mn-dependent DtxR family transcriptional regulator